MIQNSGWANYKTSTILFAVCVLIFIVILIEWNQFGTHEPGGQSGANKPIQDVNWLDEVPEPVGLLKHHDTYHEITQRPLFFQSRRPIESDIDEIDSFNGDPEFDLTGVMVTPQGLSALIRDNKGQSHHLKLGEEINGWVLNAVYGHKIYLKKDDERKVILLRVPRKQEETVAQKGVKPAPTLKTKPILDPLTKAKQQKPD
jgi:hypothetical protein